MEYIYLPCIDRIKAHDHLFTDHGLKPIAHFDLFKNQYIYPELHHIYKKPALFYEYRASWTSRDHKTQDGVITVRWHLELENYAASFDRSKNQNRALAVFKYHRLVKALLHGFKSETFSTLNCTEEEPDLNPTTTNVHVITFTTKVTDDLAEQIRKMGITMVAGEEIALNSVPLKDDQCQNRYQID